MRPFITLEEHFLSDAIPPHSIWTQSPVFTRLLDPLKDTCEKRIASMDANNIAMQVLSHIPPHDRDFSATDCAAINNALASDVAKAPTRLAGFATLPMHDPAAAVSELERCIKELGFLGSLVDNTTRDGTFYDSHRFWPVFEAHQRLNVPIYIHPTFASEHVSGLMYQGEGFGEVQSMLLGGPAFGWHAGVAVHFMRLFAAGVFDEFPKLKVIIGHDGELLPFNLERTAGMPKEVWGRERGLMEVWDENVWVTTSGMFSLHPLRCLLGVTKKDRVLLSIDYPFSPNEKGKDLMDRLKESGLISDEELDMMGSGNAKRLLGLE